MPRRARLLLVLPIVLSCAVDAGTRPRTAAKGTPTPPQVAGATPTPAPKPTQGTPVPEGSDDLEGGFDQDTSRLPTATPLGTATPKPTEVPRAYGDTDDEIVYGSTTSRLAFAASRRGYVILADGQLGEFPSVGLGGAFTWAAGVTGLAALSPDGSGGLWVAGATSQDLRRLTGGALTAGTQVPLAFAPALVAADATRSWVSGPAGEGLAYAVATGATSSVTFSEVPAGLAPDGGGVWAVSASGTARLYTAPGDAPSPPTALGGDLGALDAADGGGVWAAIKGPTPKLIQLTKTASRSVDLTAGEVPQAAARGGFGKAWVITDKALYLVETMPGDVLQARRYARTETWVPGGAATDPDDPRKLYVSDPAAKAVRRVYTGS